MEAIYLRGKGFRCKDVCSIVNRQSAGGGEAVDGNRLCIDDRIGNVGRPGSATSRSCGGIPTKRGLDIAIKKRHPQVGTLTKNKIVKEHPNDQAQ
ncbi:MAG: hypothetical protein A2020_10435 [Lentisphaerae bacterium GWF2_45_14]|nr:MAG: hypothetical protein A2020_10435 [Lentisphaerae bacterium GWF2_45_14]